MKIFLTLLSFIFFVAPPVFSQSADENDIKSMLSAAAAASGTQSWADVAKNYWILDNSTTYYCSYSDGAFVEMYADQMKAGTAAPADAPATTQLSNFQIVVSGNAASVAYDQQRTGANGEKIFTHEILLVEKNGGSWKIHLSTVHRYIP